MPSRDAEYQLIAVLHDQLNDIETYEHSLKGSEDCDECRELWLLLKQRAEEAVTLLREEIKRHAVE